MASKVKKSTIKKAWEDSWKWLLGTKMGWVVSALVASVVGGLIAGITGAIVAIVLTIVIVFIFHLIITPARLDKEARYRFIRDNANYFSRKFGSKQKRKCLNILDILKSMVKIENEVTDSIVGRMNASPDEINQMKRKFTEQTKIPTLPDSKALKIFLSGQADKKINQTINKLNLNIMGNMPTENQIEFFIRTRAVVDGSRFGMAGRLPKEYLECSQKFDELIEQDEDLLDWMIFLLVFPSGFNSAYLWYCCQGEKRQKFFQHHVQTPKSIRETISEFKQKREDAINQLIEYAENSINNM